MLLTFPRTSDFASFHHDVHSRSSTFQNVFILNDLFCLSLFALPFGLIFGLCSVTVAIPSTSAILSLNAKHAG